MMTFLKSSTTQPRTLAAIVFLLALAALVVFLRSRPLVQTPYEGNCAGPIEVARTNLVLENGRWRQPGGASVFSGLMLEYYPDGALRSRSAIASGLLHGLSEGWHTNAQLQVTEHFKEGVSHGLRTKWYAGGAKQSEANIVDGQLQGLFRKWYENGRLSEQVEFMAGQPEGISFSYFPSGCLKARVVMKDGKPVDQEFWKDGERKGSDKARQERTSPPDGRPPLGRHGLFREELESEMTQAVSSPRFSPANGQTNRAKCRS